MHTSPTVGRKSREEKRGTCTLMAARHITSHHIASHCTASHHLAPDRLRACFLRKLPDIVPMLPHPTLKTPDPNLLPISARVFGDRPKIRPCPASCIAYTLFSRSLSCIEKDICVLAVPLQKLSADARPPTWGLGISIRGRMVCS